MAYLFRPLIASVVLAVASACAMAADTGPEPAPAALPSAADPLAAARGQIAAQRWAAAITELKKLDAIGSADWNNLMGYTLRKQARPDLDGAQRHYDAALKIDPKHQGALEYSGELALMKGDVTTAEARLVALGRLCSSPCEALDDLRQAIANYKAGKR